MKGAAWMPGTAAAAPGSTTSTSAAPGGVSVPSPTPPPQPAPSTSYGATPYGTIKEYIPGAQPTWDPRMGATGGLTQPGAGTIIEHDPDAQQRDRDLADWKTRMALTKQMGGSPGAGGAGGGGTPSDGGGGGTTETPLSQVLQIMQQFKPDPVQPLQMQPREKGAPMEDETAAQAAEFAKAADRINQVGQSNLRSLRNQLTARGLTGGGAEDRAISSVKNTTAGQLGDVIRQQAVEKLQREQQINDRDLSSNVTQRGQDQSVNMANYDAALKAADWRTGALSNVLALLRAGVRQ